LISSTPWDALACSTQCDLKEHDTLEDILGNNQLLSADRTKQWIFKKGDTLQRIAAQDTAIPIMAPIAEANNIDNPLTIAVGRALKVPALT
jgi:nucleoid-associated protein YgaU